MEQKKSLIEELENRVEGDLKWKKIEEIPDFPFGNFNEAKEKIKAGEYSTGIDFTTSNRLAQSIYGGVYSFFFMVLGSTPFIAVPIAILLAFYLGNYWLLFGAVIGFLGQFTANPYNPARGFFNLFVWVLFLAFLYSLFVGNQTGATLIAFYVFPFWINRYLYNNNQKKLLSIVLQSEKVLIYLFQLGKLGFKNTSTGQSFWHKEAVMQEMDEILKRQEQK